MQGKFSFAGRLCQAPPFNRICAIAPIYFTLYTGKKFLGLLSITWSVQCPPIRWSARIDQMIGTYRRFSKCCIKSRITIDHLSDNPRYRGVHRLQSITSPITRYRAGHRQQTEAVQNFFPCAPSISNLRVATLLKICNSFYCRSPNISFRLSSD